MPSRRDIFINHHYYHIFNRTLDERKIFQNERLSQLFFHLLTYYRSLKANLRYSHFIKLPENLRKEKEKLLRYRKYYKIDILCYCLMPNHFHFLVRQKHEKGIIKFMSDTINALTRYFNVLYRRKGPLFIPQFKSRYIMNDEQLIHVSRYIHLNPYSSGSVKTYKELVNYPLSSFREYSSPKENQIVNTQIILDIFNNKINNYRKFVLDNAEYQKTLEAVKYIEYEKWS